MLSTPVVVQEKATEKARAYRTLGIVAFAHAVTHMFSALMPIIYPLAMQEFGFDYAQLGIMLGLGNALMGLAQGVYGFLTRLVARRVIMGVSQILLAVGSFAMMFAGGLIPFFPLTFCPE